MSEESSLEASALDAKSVTLNVDNLLKLIKETVRKDLASVTGICWFGCQW